jgi:uncharacterized MAPEG superfamily protein
MLELILCAIALALVQIFAMPALNLHQMKYLLSNRDTEIELSPMAERVQRAAKNLQESLPIFLTLALPSRQQRPGDWLVAVPTGALFMLHTEHHDAPLGRLCWLVDRIGCDGVRATVTPALFVWHYWCRRAFKRLWSIKPWSIKP